MSHDLEEAIKAICLKTNGDLNFKLYILGLAGRDGHRLAGLHGCTVRVVVAMASGRDFTAQAPPVAMPQVA
jgi:hypothetical protein